MDMRYRVYGPLEGFNYRVDIGTGNSDFITVGKLDFPNVGPYRYKKEGVTVAKILRDFHLLKDVKQILDEQFVVEKNIVKVSIEKWKEFHGEEPPIIEVANEPNLFPYVKPELYAYYYMKWASYVRELSPNCKLMNGGFFMSDDYPEFIKRLLKIGGIKSTYEYCKTFLKIVSEENTQLLPDVLNLHLYPYMGKVFHSEQMDKSFDSLKKYEEFGYDIWFTEVGNLNPYNMNATYLFTKQLLDQLEASNVKRWYYFETQGGDEKLESLPALSKKVDTAALVWKILSFPMRIWGIKWLLNKIGYKIGFINIDMIDEMIESAKLYCKNVPIQCLVDVNGKLNKIGELYKWKANK
jgi:hypothetical protein